MFRKIAISWILILVCLFWGCDFSESSGENRVIASRIDLIPDSLHEDFLKVPSAGNFVYLGTNDEFVPQDERPLMKASFSYDFSIGKHEVTCGMFNSVMKRAGYEKLSEQTCEKDSFPVVNVSYFDVVLFSNALSKKAGLDSVYTYESATFDGEGHCKDLEGFSFNPDKDGFRLPTEAEWMFVAAQDWFYAGGWTSENSQGTLHKVCTAEPPENASKVCDMMGNAMEWVNDWLGNFRDKPVKNFVGAADGGSFGARIVKGGSFKNEKTSLHLYRRSDVYTVMSSSHSDYVGFRLAIGKIPEPTWLNQEGASLAKPISILANSYTLWSKTGSFKSKLAFRNDQTGNLAFVNYESANLTVTEIEDSLEVYHPDISPDGEKVAFCTGMEGVTSKSQVYVRNLDVTGSNLVKLDVESAAIPRWRILDSGDTVIVYVTDAGNNKGDLTFSENSTWQVPFAKGKFGKPKKLFDGAYHGGVRKDNRLAVTGARLLRAKINSLDTLWYNGEQACNVSLSQDERSKTLFLDFAGKTGQSFAGKEYGVHEMLLELDSAGNLDRMIPSPRGYSFDHSEWILSYGKSGRLNSDLAVVSLANRNGVHEKIALVDLKDSSVMDLVKGEEIWHPCLWSQGNSLQGLTLDFDVDSAGVYLSPGGAFVHECLRVKMELLWKNVEKIEYLCVGSSRMAMGMIPDQLTAGFSVNMGHPDNDLDASAYIAENYGLNVLPNLKAIVVGLDFDLWKIRMEFSNMIFSASPGYLYDAHHGFWKGGVLEHFVEAVESSYPASTAMQSVYYDSRGWSYSESAGWGEAFTDADISWSDNFDGNLTWNLKRLRKLVEKAGKKNIAVVGVIFPQNPGYRDTDSWGRYGPRRSAAQRVKDSVLAMVEEFPNFHVLDENKMGDHDYGDNMALDCDHISGLGGVQLTSRLDSLLKKLK